jgi:hypothetical protein
MRILFLRFGSWATFGFPFLPLGFEGSGYAVCALRLRLYSLRIAFASFRALRDSRMCAMIPITVAIGMRMKAREIKPPMMVIPIVSTSARVSVIISGCLSCFPLCFYFNGFEVSCQVLECYFGNSLVTGLRLGIHCCGV